MSDPNVEFCRSLLRACRDDAKAAKVRIPKLIPYRLSDFHNPYYDVFSGDPNGGIVWSGNAYNAYDAKAKAIEKLLAAANES